LVNPANGWCNTADLIVKAKRAKALGLRVMLVLNYSDEFGAFLNSQEKPAAWRDYDFDKLKSTVYDYTLDILNTLKSNGVVPTWVQIGNGVKEGFILPDGSYNNMANFAALFNAGYQAVKASNNSIKVILHIGTGGIQSDARLLDDLKSNGAHWDVIGVSSFFCCLSNIYLDQLSRGRWREVSENCFTRLKDLVSRYNNEVMVCETGMYMEGPGYSYLLDLMNKIKSLPDNKGLGIFYFEPIREPYVWSAFSEGKPTRTLTAFTE
jgi:arabinogalactan endo-1,4-beta-galactosidase